MPLEQFRYVAEHAFPRKVALRYYRLANIVWLWIALAIIAGFVSWRLEPHSPAQVVDAKLHDLTVIWAFHLTGLLSGLALAAGVWWYLPRLEVLGHVLLAAFIGVSTVAVADLDTGVGTIAFITTISIAAASACRCYYLIVFTPELGRHHP